MFEIIIVIQLAICLFATLLQRGRENYSIASSVIVFHIIFYIITPLVTKHLGISFWAFHGSNDLYDYASFATALFIATYVIMSEIFYRLSIKAPKREEIRVGPYNRKMMYFLLVISLLGQLFFNDFDLNRMFFRDYSGDQSEITTGRVGWLFNLTVAQSLPAILFLYLHLYRGRDFRVIDQVVVVVFMLLIAAPTVLPRFMAGVFYVPILYIYLFSKRRIDYRYTMFALLLAVFPLLDTARYISNQGSVEGISATELIVGNFTQGHLDAFQSIMMAIDSQEIFFGSQLLGALLFFVPRTFWDSKPIGTGQEIAESMSLSFTNVSMSFVGEMYVNFSYIGVIIGAALFSYFSAKSDKKFKMNLNSPAGNIFYIMFVPMTILFMRGDTISAISYTTGIILAVHLWVFVFKRALR